KAANEHIPVFFHADAQRGEIVPDVIRIAQRCQIGSFHLQFVLADLNAHIHHLLFPKIAKEPPSAHERLLFLFANLCYFWNGNFRRWANMRRNFEIFTAPNRIGDMYMSYYGQETCEPGHTYGPAVRNHFLYVFAATGRGYYKVRDVEY